mmetsp:Transcript_21318/g.42890  ORF Transcript_21318/g.42890 Transcript_21318/m.42890 type:complete len:205 (+) Transcript_21318:787-1401(+)
MVDKCNASRLCRSKKWAVNWRTMKRACSCPPTDGDGTTEDGSEGVGLSVGDVSPSSSPHGSAFCVASAFKRSYMQYSKTSLCLPTQLKHASCSCRIMFTSNCFRSSLSKSCTNQLRSWWTSSRYFTCFPSTVVADCDQKVLGTTRPYITSVPMTGWHLTSNCSAPGALHVMRSVSYTGTFIWCSLGLSAKAVTRTKGAHSGVTL